MKVNLFDEGVIQESITVGKREKIETQFTIPKKLGGIQPRVKTN